MTFTMARIPFRKSVLALIMAGAMLITTTACNTGWVTETEQIVTALLPAVANIITLVAALSGKSVSAQDLQIVQAAGTQTNADLQLLLSLIQQYDKADATSQATLMTEIQNAVAIAQSNLNAILPALHIKDAATQAKISAVVGICLSEIQALAALIPIVHPAASMEMKAAAIKAATVHPPLSARQFVDSYNHAMTGRTGNPDVDRVAAGLAVHRHGKVVRVLYLGLSN